MAAAAGSLMTGGSATDRLEEMAGLGWSVAVAVEETKGEENAVEGKIGLDNGFLSGCEVRGSGKRGSGGRVCVGLSGGKSTASGGKKKKRSGDEGGEGGAGFCGVKGEGRW